MWSCGKLLWTQKSSHKMASFDDLMHYEIAVLVSGLYLKMSEDLGLGAPFRHSSDTYRQRR